MRKRGPVGVGVAGSGADLAPGVRFLGAVPANALANHPRAKSHNYGLA